MGLFGFKSKRRLGIDIGTASIKIVELSKDAGRLRLENYGLFELESIEEAINVGVQNEAQTSRLTDTDLTWGIKETLKRCKISSADVIASIPSFNTFSTIISVPFLSEQDISKTIAFEARKYIPLPLSEVVFDWSIINVDQNNPDKILPNENITNRTPMVEVYIVAVPKEETQRYQSVMKQANLNLRALELENTAVIRSLIGNDLSPIVVINIGGRSTSILIVEKGFERVSHNYEVGGFEITKSIARSLNINLKRAEEMKRSLGLKEASSGMITEALSSLVDLIAFETKKTIHNYEDVRKTKISKIMVVGGLANMPMFVEYFGNKLGMPISLGNPLARVILPPGLDQLRPELNSTFTISLGLAMREI